MIKTNQAAIVKYAEEVCKKDNLQFTKYRKKALELILKSPSAMKAYDLLKKLDKKGLPPPVIYRALDFLMEKRLIHKISSNSSYVACHHPEQIHSCYFLICIKCHNISECCDSELDNAIEKLAEKNKFTPQNPVLEISGLCQKCSKA